MISDQREKVRETHAVEDDSAERRDEALPRVTTRTNLENVVLPHFPWGAPGPRSFLQTVECQGFLGQRDLAPFGV